MKYTNNPYSITKQEADKLRRRAAELSQWLETHHATEKACWVGVKRGRGQSSSHSRPYISASAPTTWPFIRKGIL